MSTNPIALLVSNDYIEIQATLQAIKQCLTLSIMLEVLDEDQTAGLPIPIPEMDGETLAKIMQWCEHHRGDSIPDPNEWRTATASNQTQEITKWDTEFLNIDRELLFKLTNGANYLEIPLLLQYAVLTVALKLEDMSSKRMCEFLNVENDFTPEQELQTRKEYAWANQQ
ncbi:hypothetical protein E0Z10_g1922 [Xylaria hypoxylon]|uniref:E3 ubiquitin ligase complex SCF subunit n=1 Tax=Xylaria hypoxylon TaxID=37992 RepID=A0A4Z0YR68_9PEZI|nr:hypothetical protein E0Z10_g1922 [Xylaria hypoxylon]